MIPFELNLAFPGFSKEEVQKLFSIPGLWEQRHFDSGAFIFEEGSNTTDLYLLVQGRVEISKYIGTDPKHRKILGILTPGSLFGEGALLSNQPRSASAKALEAVEALALSQSQFKKLLEERAADATALLIGLLKVVNQRLLWTNQELVTLYEVAQLVSETKDDLFSLAQRIADKIAYVTHSPRGVLALENPVTLHEEVRASWGSLDLSLADLERFEKSLGHENSCVVENYFVVSIHDLSRRFLGLVVMEKAPGWTPEAEKISIAIAEQLGIAIADYQFLQSEAGRSRLSQQNVQF